MSRCMRFFPCLASGTCWRSRSGVRLRGSTRRTYGGWNLPRRYPSAPAQKSASASASAQSRTMSTRIRLLRRAGERTGSQNTSAEGPRGSADAPWAELDADARAGRPGGLGYRVLPGALAAAAHDEQVAVTHLVPDGRAAAARTQRQRPRGADGKDRDHGVLGRAAPDGVAVPGDAVPAVAVQAQAGGA